MSRVFNMQWEITAGRIPGHRKGKNAVCMSRKQWGTCQTRLSLQGLWAAVFIRFPSTIMDYAFVRRVLLTAKRCILLSKKGSTRAVWEELNHFNVFGKKCNLSITLITYYYQITWPHTAVYIPLGQYICEYNHCI